MQEFSNFTNGENLKESVMPSFHCENLSIEINLSEGKFIDLIRLNQERFLDVRNDALEVRLLCFFIFLFTVIGNLQIF